MFGVEYEEDEEAGLFYIVVDLAFLRIMCIKSNG
jgi:hypothetical protein